MEELEQSARRPKSAGPSLVMTSRWGVPRPRCDRLEPRAEDLISMRESFAGGVYISLYASHGKA